ncbi:MAG: RagB/SusD family nutrient uptake outer membrane protein [Paludibacteraceae bacterium]
MKTKYLKLFTFISMLLVLSSCTDWLTIEPEGKVVSTQYWKLESDVEAVVATCYRAMIEDDVIERMIVYGEVRSDDVTEGDVIDTELRYIMQANLLPSNSYTKWASFYKIINYCNVVIYYAPKVKDPNFTQSELNAKLAEVLTLKSLCYFYLVRAFGEVPFINDPSISDSQDYSLAKSPENVILDSIESNLLKAENWAMSGYGSTEATKGRITKNAVRAFLADVYLWRQQYDKCITYCDKVISSPLLKLMGADDKIFYNVFGLKNSTESIFELQFSQIDKTYNSSLNTLYGRNDLIGQLMVPELITTTNDVFTNTPTITDVRRKDYMSYLTLYDKNWRIFKYPGLSREEFSDVTLSKYNYRSYQTSPANWIIYRLTDVILMKAEALTQKNELAGAIHLVNTTYMRANPTLNGDTLKLSSYNDKKQMEELVLLERQRELMFEGKRWFDLVRLARRDGDTKRLVKLVLRKYTSNQSVISGKLQKMDALYFPINEDELNSNPNLKQNPFYDSKFN